MIALAACTVLLGCTRAAEEATSFSIQIPTGKQMSAKDTSIQSALDFDLLCFVVDIQGNGIKAKEADTCSPSRGQVLGSVSSGSSISGSIVSGIYNFKIYALRRDSLSEECPRVTPDSWNWPLAKVYMIGESLGQKVAGEKADISIKLSMPDSANNLITQNSMPTICNSVGAPGNQLVDRGRIQLGAKPLVGTTYKMYARFNSIPQTQDLTGSQHKIQNWKVSP